MNKDMFSTKILAFLTASVLLGAMLSIHSLQAQPFDITTEQSATDQQAVITVKLATNNTVVIPPNGTVIEVPGNVTQIDNDTIVIAPENETVTEIPDSNVTVITPPAPEPCSCPAQNVTEQPDEGGIDPVIVTPAPGQEVITENGTELVANESQEEPIPIPPPANDTSSGNDTGGPTLPVEPEQPADNQTDTGTGDGNQTADDGEIPPASDNNNDTALAPASSTQETPWYMPFSRT